MKTVVILSILLYSTLTLKSQPQKPDLNKELIEFFQRLEIYHGTIYVDTTYESLDTSDLIRKATGEELNDALSVIRFFNMQTLDPNYKAISGDLKNIISVDSFFKLRDPRKEFTPYEIQYSRKLDSVRTMLNYSSLKNDLSDEFKKVDKLLYRSTFDQAGRFESYRSKNYLVKILSVFESKDYFLVIYSFSVLDSYLHSYLKVELILK